MKWHLIINETLDIRYSGNALMVLSMPWNYVVKNMAKSVRDNSKDEKLYLEKSSTRASTFLHIAHQFHGGHGDKVTVDRANMFEEEGFLIRRINLVQKKRKGDEKIYAEIVNKAKG